MGIIFSNKQQKVQIKDLLNTPLECLILSRLQAGREILPNGVNAPYRLNKEQLELLQDEYIWYELDESEGVYYARFDKPVVEIRKILNLPIEHVNPLNPFDVF